MLFLFSEENPPIEEQLYLFLKRFHTQPSEFYKLDREVRLKLYKREFKLLEAEYEEAQKAKSQSNNS